ncbi:hypothetical protein D3C71_296290 [compost metagenome]
MDMRICKVSVEQCGRIDRPHLRGEYAARRDEAVCTPPLKTVVEAFIACNETDFYSTRTAIT